VRSLCHPQASHRIKAQGLRSEFNEDLFANLWPWSTGHLSNNDLILANVGEHMDFGTQDFNAITNCGDAGGAKLDSINTHTNGDCPSGTCASKGRRSATNVQLPIGNICRKQ
jgi:hypothetical protein